MAGESKVTTDHETIQKWAEARGGKPATVTRTEYGDGAGVLRIDFPGYSGKGSLEEITWDEFFAKLDGSYEVTVPIAPRFTASLRDALTGQSIAEVTWNASGASDHEVHDIDLP